ncbi:MULTISPECIES: YhjD/YihY/BrkB family envelope integrity protein [unclassified Actinomyces]|nr:MULTISPECIES: YhjD/YihY/BrkB family envelope integrity protein [unclassified Actinomyces]MCL3777692.1 YihY/virulence factor BrkB family protein [Actinomyces sp. AC-20-1]MCL3790153.1 YihY/virulence factor BrkB family protein [Actinomyces sp. 187325]MCL3792498.1 YihY/virulence factor BrkB family protein [Actinomyces sp. 186855]MCL3793855.1 YihY/virulence factor BrkB family protein [Actinomyces sp. 217892]
MASRPGRTQARYTSARGPLLAGGIAYTGLFSVFAALAIGVTALMTALGSHPGLRDAAISAIDDMLPGVLDDGSGNGIVSIDQLTLDSALNPGSVIALLALLYSALGLMRALSSGVRAMFGIVRVPRNIVVAELTNLLGFLVIMVSVVVTAAASLVTGALVGALEPLPGWLPSWVAGGSTRVLTLAVSLLIDSAVLALLIRSCGVRVPRNDLLRGAALGGLAFGVLRALGTGAVGSAGANPLLASFTALVVLVLWLHLASRVVLYVCAWTANPPAPAVIDHPDEVHASQTPNYVTLSAPETLSWPRQDITGTLEVDPTAHPDYESDDGAHDSADDSADGDAGAEPSGGRPGSR